MGRKAAPQPLSLGSSVRPSDDSRLGETVPHSARLPPDPASPRSPRSPLRLGQKTPEITEGPLQLAEVLQPPKERPDQPPQPQPQQQRQRQQYQYQPQQRPESRDPPLPSPRGRVADQQQPPGHRNPRRGDDKASKSSFFFNFGKPTKSSDRPVAYQYSGSRSETMSRDSDHPTLSTRSPKHSDPSHQDLAVQRPNVALSSRSQVSLASSTDYDNPANASKKSKPKPFNLLSRTRSTKDKDSRDSPSPKEQHTPALARIPEPETPHTLAVRTAPPQTHDRSFRDMMSSAVRNHSAERSQSRDIGGRGRDHESHHRGLPSSLRDASGSAFFSNLKHSKAAGILSNRFFGSTRHEPAAPREPVVDDEHYVIKVINLPLIQQARLTRISKRLEDSRDKTEFWMPAFPWRAIDYLNYKGSEVEGLYRVPGSGPQIKRWQRKFDEELDVDLFEQPDLYDINIIGSMLKAWLRELPDELFPKAVQDRIARECAGADKVPPLLIEELSNLPPFNYYLLFAITCHLSLLLAHSEKNKMDFRNLCICFQPCMKIDAFCFKFLVCDWRECWKGCKNEAKYIEEEYALFDQPPPPATDRRKDGGSSTGEEEKQEERSVSSSDGSSRSPKPAANDLLGRLKMNAVLENESAETNSTISTTLTVHSERETSPGKLGGDLRPLSPIKPLSPMNF
ncbi:hypothetical protein BT67DRAFT_85703 [Trichocladium antarcticum]|uniref:Rho-GAP domain-containing protein n=1 Tax=Trichocladium antarcticum TaxID=1450529 RepID=A0AAN6UIJ7_9PEZI|nr:hypothetical protein BT67DRAFT_85703 [Trichocladium antarcticum]